MPARREVSDNAIVVHRCIDYDRCYHLTEADVDILEQLALGHDIAEAATALGVRAQTIRNRRQALFHLFDVHNAASLLAKALRLGAVAITRNRRTAGQVVSSEGYPLKGLG